MLSGTTVAVVAVLVIVIGVFLLLTARKFAPPPHGFTPPDPAVKGLILSLQQNAQALQKAVAGVAEQYRQTVAAVTASYKVPLPNGPLGLPPPPCEKVSDCGSSLPPRARCGDGHCEAPVDPAGPLGDRDKVQDAGAKLNSALTTFGGDVEDYNKHIGEWSAATPFPTFLALQEDTAALSAGGVGKLIEAIAGTANALDSLISSWVDAFNNRNLTAGSDRNLGPLLGTMGDTLRSFNLLAPPPDGPPSPLQTAANSVSDSYGLLVNHFLVPDIPGMPGL